MPSRRISSVPALAPVQEISVNPYSSYNSDNVNALTRIVTGQKNKDVVVNGLDLKGVNTVLIEVLDTPFISEFFDYVGSSSSFASNWVTDNFDVGDNNLVATIPSGTYATATAQYEYQVPTTDIGFWFKVEFTLTNVPKTLYFVFGSETKVYDHPIAGDYTFFIQLYNNSGTFENFKIVAQLDSTDTTSDDTITIDDLTVTKVWNRATEIEPISLPEANSPDTYNEVQLNHNRIQTQLLHPHTVLNVYPGIAVKDEAVVTITGTQTDQPALVLTYSDPNCWIKGVPMTVADFPESTPTAFVSDGDLNEYPATFDANGVLTGVTISDDGFIPSPYYTKISGNSSTAFVKWAYVVMYYSYFKNPNPNQSYIGLAHADEINSERFGEDYLILGKLRFIDVNTVDAIIYYPDRPDLAYIDATRVTYLHLNQLKHWLNKPVNVSLALDLLASRIYNWKGVLYFPTHSDFIDWTNRVQGSATGHGPADFQQWINGMDPQNGYDLLAFVVETNTFFKSKISGTSGKYVLTVQWEEIALKTFEVNWSGLNTGNWPVSIPSNWQWYKAEDGTKTSVSKTYEEAIAAYPNYYYIEECGGTELHHTIVNPYNPEGRGTVPGPLAKSDGNSDVKLNKFLRADGSWQFAGGGAINFFVQGYLVAPANLAQIVFERSTVLNTVRAYIDDLPGGSDHVTFELWHRTNAATSVVISTTPNITIEHDNTTQYIIATFTPIPFSAGDLLILKCTATGTTPYEGGSNTAVTVYYS